MIVQRSVRSWVGIHLLDIDTMELYEKPYDHTNSGFNIQGQDGKVDSVSMGGLVT